MSERDAMDYAIWSAECAVDDLRHFVPQMTEEDAALLRGIADELRDMANRVTRVAA